MNRWIAAAAPDDVDLEDVVPFDVDGRPYALYRTAADSFHATDGYCTHERELLCDGLVEGSVVECPKHNGRFDVTSGKALGAPALVDLVTYPTKVEGDVVYVALP